MAVTQLVEKIYSTLLFLVELGLQVLLGFHKFGDLCIYIQYYVHCQLMSSRASWVLYYGLR